MSCPFEFDPCILLYVFLKYHKYVIVFKVALQTRHRPKELTDSCMKVDEIFSCLCEKIFITNQKDTTSYKKKEIVARIKKAATFGLILKRQNTGLGWKIY